MQTEPPGDQSAPRSWEQQPGESDRDFAAFQIFIALGSGASKAAVALKDGRSRVYIFKIAKRWRWADRAVDCHRELHADSKPDEDPDARRAVAAALARVGPRPPIALSPAGVPMVREMHLQKVSDYQSRAERLGNAQLSIAGQLFQIAQQRLTDHREGKTINLKTVDLERLIRTAVMASTAGHKLLGEALGVEEMFLAFVEHLQPVGETPAQVK
jgi:hypothetical protein